MPKITQLTADTAPTSDDLTVIVNDPAGTPGTKKATLANVITKAHGLTDGIVSSGSGTLNTTLSLDTDTTLAANSDTKISSQKAVKTYTDNILGNANALVYKGVVDCSSNPNYPTADAGFLYVVSVAGKIGGASGIDVEVGDMVICNTDGTASGNQATVGQYWNIIQKNIVGAVTGPASAVTDNIAVFDGTTGKVIKDGGAKTSDFITKALIDAKGDLIVGSADNTPSILTSSGSNGNVLTVDTSTATGLKWAAPAGGGQTAYDIIVAPSGGDYTTLTAALAAATAGQTIFVRSGTYTETRLNSSTLTTADLTIIGENVASTILQCATTYGFVFSGTNINVQNIRFELGTSSSQFKVTGNNSYINNCYFLMQNTSTGASNQVDIDGDYTKIYNCYFKSTSTTQTHQQRIVHLGNDYGVVENCTFETVTTENTTNGTITVTAIKLNITSCLFLQPSTSVNNGYMLVPIAGSSDLIIDSCYFIIDTGGTNLRGRAIYTSGASVINCTVSNCNFTGSTHAIFNSGSDKWVISSNYFNSGDPVIDLRSSSNHTIIGNFFNRRAVYTNNVPVLTFSGNRISSSSGVCIELTNHSTSDRTTSDISNNNITAGGNNYAVTITNPFCNISNNIINGAKGLFVSGEGCVISNNYISPTSNFGIENTGTGALIQNNFITGKNSRAISNTGTYCVIRGNSIGDDTDLVNTSATASLFDNYFMYESSTSGNAKYAGTLRNEYKTIFMKNTSGGSLAAGDVVIFKSVATADEVTTTTTAGDDKVFGMAVETIADNAVGLILVSGKTTLLKVNGTTDIAIGDYLTTFTTAKIAAKASAGDMVFAVALEAYTGDDSNGVIDALLISPRLI